MIVRILAEGQHDVADDELPGLDALDAEVEAALDLGDEVVFRAALGRLLDRVREVGVAVAADVLVPSDLVLPPPDASIDDVRHLFVDGGQGLVPG